jgi:DeoR family transcriptional regulator, fructose operon transcriptional repressor
VRRHGRVDVATLAEELAVTTETVRRDLDQLERRGLVRRVHGGALPVERLRLEAEVSERSLAMAAENERIAKAALAHVPHEGTVLIDAGTTTARLAELLPDDRELTVVTNSLPIALTLATRLRLTVLTVGGRVRGKTLAQVDRWALRSLAEIRVDVAFLATNGGVPPESPLARQSRISGFGQTVLTESPYVHRGIRAPARAGRAP